MDARFRVPLWIVAWVLTRALIVAQVGFWNHVYGIQLEDVNVFHTWSNFIAANHKLPHENTWQYPPGAAFLMLVPRIGGGDFGTAWVVMMLLFDLAGLGLLVQLANRERRDIGVWVWLLAMPLLFTLPVLRFDLVPTVIAVAALVVIHRRPAWFGALAGLGAMVKVWPIFALFGEWDRKRLLRSVLGTLAVIVAIFAIAQVLFGDQTGFIVNQGDRGLEIEAVAATPWQLRQAITGTLVPSVPRFGTNEIDSGIAEAVARLLDLAAVAVLVAAAVWWRLRERAIRHGREDLADPVLSRDFVFTLVLLFVVVSRVLSPQYLIWLIGLCAVVLSARTTRVSRPAWIVLGAVILTAGLYQSPVNFVIRNLALLAAAVDASVLMLTAVLDRSRDRDGQAGADGEPVSTRTT